MYEDNELTEQDCLTEKMLYCSMGKCMAALEYECGHV